MSYNKMDLGLGRSLEGQRQLAELESENPMLACTLRLSSSARRFATVAAGIDRQNRVYNVFDRNAKRMQKDRAAKRDSGERSRRVDYLFEEVADRLTERLMVSIHFLFSSERLIQCSYPKGYQTIVLSHPGHRQRSWTSTKITRS